MLAQKWSARRVVGVDIDGDLVRKAWMRRRTVWSRQSPLSPSDSNLKSSHPPGPTNESGRKTKKRKLIADSDSTTTPGATLLATARADYFPASCLHMFGHLPVPPSSTPDKDLDKKDVDDGENGPPVVLPKDHEFPHNVSFRHSDWPVQPIPEDAEGYDVVIAYVSNLLSHFQLFISPYTFATPIVLCNAYLHSLAPIRFSITKWIHLNTSDAGLKMFFRRVYDVLRKGGTFVLEPQGWESYAKARKLDPVRSFLFIPPPFVFPFYSFRLTSPSHELSPPQFIPFVTSNHAN